MIRARTLPSSGGATGDSQASNATSACRAAGTRSGGKGRGCQAVSTVRTSPWPRSACSSVGVSTCCLPASQGATPGGNAGLSGSLLRRMTAIGPGTTSGAGAAGRRVTVLGRAVKAGLPGRFGDERQPALGPQQPAAPCGGGIGIAVPLGPARQQEVLGEGQDVEVRMAGERPGRVGRGWRPVRRWSGRRAFSPSLRNGQELFVLERVRAPGGRILLFSVVVSRVSRLNSGVRPG